MYKKIMKKGNIFDPVEAGYIVLGVTITLFIVFIVVDNFNINIVGNNATNITAVVEPLGQHKERFLVGWDLAVLLCLILFPIFSYFSAQKIEFSNQNLVIAIFLLFIFFIIMMIFSNIHGKMLDNASYSNFVNQTKFIKVLLPILPYYSIFYTILVFIGLVNKKT